MPLISLFAWLRITAAPHFCFMLQHLSHVLGIIVADRLTYLVNNWTACGYLHSKESIFSSVQVLETSPWLGGFCFINDSDFSWIEPSCNGILLLILQHINPTWSNVFLWLHLQLRSEKKETFNSLLYYIQPHILMVCTGQSNTHLWLWGWPNASKVYSCWLFPMSFAIFQVCPSNT